MTDGPKQPAPPGPRKPYATPVLTRFGHIKDIVQGGGGKKADGLFGPKTKMCWVAEAIYGRSDPRTLLLRAWLSDIYVNRRRGFRAAALYRRVGFSVATLVERRGVLRVWLRPAFDRLVAAALEDVTRRMDRTGRTRR